MALWSTYCCLSLRCTLVCVCLSYDMTYLPLFPSQRFYSVLSVSSLLTLLMSLQP